MKLRELHMNSRKTNPTTIIMQNETENIFINIKLE